MRNKLKKLGGKKRYTFTAVVGRFSLKNGFRGLPLKTILLLKIKCEGVVVTNHIWLTYGRRFHSAVLMVGDLIQFDARIKEYEKGYKGRRLDVYKPISKDYGFSYPSKIKIIARGYNKIKD